MVVLNRLFYHFIHFSEKKWKNRAENKTRKNGKIVNNVIVNEYSVAQTVT